MISIKHVKLFADAISDLEVGAEFYNRQQPGIGDYFWDSLMMEMLSWILYVDLHDKWYSYSRMLSHNYPYAIYYEVKEEVAYVIAVLPLCHDPERIRKQISARN